MLAVEQFHNPRLGDLYARQYVEDPLTFQGALFGLLMQGGHLLLGDATATALYFYAPVFLLITLCDCRPDKETEALAMNAVSYVGYGLFSLTSSGYAGKIQDVMHMVVTALVVGLSIASLVLLVVGGIRRREYGYLAIGNRHGFAARPTFPPCPKFTILAE